MLFKKSKKCKICKARRAVRFCVRTGKRICWHDCNELRVDYRCPESCKYTLLKPDDEQLFHYKTNADSMAEFTDLLKKEMDRWIITPQKLFKDKIPLNMAESEKGRGELESVFKHVNNLNHIPLQYLYNRLKLNLKVEKETIKNPEKVAEEYLFKLIEQDYEASIEYLVHFSQYKKEDFLTNYKSRHQQNRVFKKMVEIDLLSSALSEDKLTCLVHFDVNEKFDLTVVLRLIEDNWLVASKYCGKPEIFNGENEAIQQVAILLSKNQLANAFKLLQQYSLIYPESADLAYYWGLYYAFSENLEKAEQYFFSAIELDSSFLEAKFNYANMIHKKKEYDKALSFYLDIIKENPEDLKSLNNIGAIYLDKQDFKEAKSWFERCLEVDSEFKLALDNIKKINETM